MPRSNIRSRATRRAWSARPTSASSAAGCAPWPRRWAPATPDALGDGLLLLIEGAYISGQLFGAGGPAQAVADNADLLIEASLARR